MAIVDQCETSDEKEMITISVLEGTSQDAASLSDTPGVIEMEDLLGRYPWARHFATFTSPYFGYTTELSAAEAVIEGYSRHMNTQFHLNKSTGTLCKEGKEYLGVERLGEVER